MIERDCRAIAREMGLARSTVLRMKYDAARLGILTRVPVDRSLLQDSISSPTTS